MPYIIACTEKRGGGKIYFLFPPFNARNIRGAQNTYYCIIIVLAMRGGGKLMRGTAPCLRALGRTLGAEYAAVTGSTRPAGSLLPS